MSDIYLKNPCENCITYAICKSNILKAIPVDYISDERTVVSLTLIFMGELAQKCSLVKEYIDNRLNVDKIKRSLEFEFPADDFQIYYFNQNLAKVLSELFNLGVDFG